MTIDEAIEINEDQRESLLERGLPVSAEAAKLGIEALKLVKELRECMPGSAVKLLPGETEDKGVT